MTRFEKYPFLWERRQAEDRPGRRKSRRGPAPVLKSHELLVTFHGGNPRVDTLLAHDDGGAKLTDTALHSSTKGSKLRALLLVSNERLCVPSGSAKASKSRALAGSGHSYGDPRRSRSTRKTAHACTLSTYPGSTSNCYVSTEDTNVVARFAVTNGFVKATPAPMPGPLPSGGTFWPGTLVASSDSSLPGDLPKPPHTTAVDAQNGLEAWQSSGATRSPRLGSPKTATDTRCEIERFPDTSPP